MAAFIYAVRCKLNGDSYIGVSAGDLHRFRDHKAGRKSNQHLQNAMKTYGIKNFSFEPIGELPDMEFAWDAEVLMIAACKEAGIRLYNKDVGGRHGHFGFKDLNANNGWDTRRERYGSTGTKKGQKVSS